MKESEMNGAIAEIDGWTDLGTDAEHVQWYVQMPMDIYARLSFEEQRKQRRYQLPNYLNSRDAIIPVVEKVCQTWEMQDKFLDAFNDILFLNEASNGDGQWVIIGATRRQIAEALLRACGKWKE